MAYLAAGDMERARTQLNKALEKVDANDTRTFVKEARDSLAKIESGGSGTGN
jgi:hypothetical protein